MVPEEQASTRVLTIPNLISFVRLGLIPIFAFLFITAEDRTGLLVSFVVVAVIGISDFLDGYLARRLGQVSELGKLLDPVADRIAIVAGMFALWLRDDRLVPIWATAAIVGRDLIVAIVFGILESRGYPRIPVNRVGKAATALIFGGLGLVAFSLVFDDPYADPLRLLGIFFLGSGAVFYWAAGVLYFREVQAIRRSTSAGQVKIQ